MMIVVCLCLYAAMTLFSRCVCAATYDHHLVVSVWCLCWRPLPLAVSFMSHASSPSTIQYESQ
jgi:hypothetical protein